MIYRRKRYGLYYESNFSVALGITYLVMSIVGLVVLIQVLMVLKGGYSLHNEIVIGTNLTDEDGFTQSYLRFPNMRYATKDLNYSITDCDENLTLDILAGLDMLRNKTVLTFTESDSSTANIKIICNRKTIKLGDFVITLAEAGPDELIIHKDYLEIPSSTVTIYARDKCPPHIIVHELLHTFGFGHNDNPNSVLYPTIDCKNQKFNQYLFDRLNEIYTPA